ncbi:MAG: hypothetical protein ABI885_04190 [Gammaproteobacteria bacterium]
MSRLARILIIVAVAAGALVAAYLLILKSSDSSTYYEYATYTELKRDTGVQAASVPEFVPRSARNISGWYNVDANIQALEFAFDRSEQADVVRRFQRATGDAGREVERKLRGYRWKDAFPEGSGLVAFTGHEEGSQFLIVDERNGRAYYAVEPSKK